MKGRHYRGCDSKHARIYVIISFWEKHVLTVNSGSAALYNPQHNNTTTQPDYNTILLESSIHLSIINYIK